MLRLVAMLGRLLFADRSVDAAAAAEPVEEVEGAGAVIIELPFDRIQAGEWPDEVPVHVPTPRPSSRAHLTVVS